MVGGADGGVTACTGALACVLGTPGNSCGTCGAAGQPCCGTGNGGVCNAGLACAGRMRVGGGASGMPGTCGVAGVPDGGAPDVPAGQ
jgi:hypothetical protein